MPLVTYQREGQSRIGTQLDKQVIDLNQAYRAVLQHTGDEDELVVADAWVRTDMIGLQGVNLLPIRAQNDVRCSAVLAAWDICSQNRRVAPVQSLSSPILPSRKDTQVRKLENRQANAP